MKCFKNKKHHEIYDYFFLHRGLHVCCPENTLESYNYAVRLKLGIEMDVRILKCGNIVCFHDRYMYRLLSVPGRISAKTYNEVKDYKILGTEYTIPKLEETLNLVNGEIPILIEIKGFMNKAYQDKLQSLLQNYNGIVFFHSKNIITYFKAKKIWNGKVYFILNPFRRRFLFAKGKDYANSQYSTIEKPTFADFIVDAEDTIKTVIEKIQIAWNQHRSRVKSNHWLISYKGKKYQIHHRGIIDKEDNEYSRESLKKCVALDKIPEIDVTSYQGNVICYHSDNISDKIGQKKSISPKTDITNALTFREALSIIDGKVPIVIDIKDFSFSDRSFEVEIMNQLKNYKGEYVIQSFNPYVLAYFEEMYPEIVRGQVVNSLNGLKVFSSIACYLIYPFIFRNGKPDYLACNLDSNFFFLLGKFMKIIGLPEIAYTAQSQEEIDKYKNLYDNIMIEGNFIE